MRSVTVVLNRLFEYSLKLNEYCLCQKYEHKRLDHTNQNRTKKRREHKHTRFGSTVSLQPKMLVVDTLLGQPWMVFVVVVFVGVVVVIIRLCSCF